MSEAAAHRVDRVLPPVRIRQRVDTAAVCPLEIGHCPAAG
jgi:hypothetical protein